MSRSPGLCSSGCLSATCTALGRCSSSSTEIEPTSGLPASILDHKRGSADLESCLGFIAIASSTAGAGAVGCWPSSMVHPGYREGIATAAGVDTGQSLGSLREDRIAYSWWPSMENVTSFLGIMSEGDSPISAAFGHRWHLSLKWALTCRRTTHIITDLDSYSCLYCLDPYFLFKIQIYYYSLRDDLYFKWKTNNLL
jgi:hypothetical protein